MDDVYLIRGETLSDIADAIREKTGGSDEIAAGDFAEEIGEIETGGLIPQSDFVKIHHEVIIVGENNINNGSDAHNFLSAAKTINGTLFAESIKKKDTYDNNEFVYCSVSPPANNNAWVFCRYRSGFVQVPLSTGYDAVLVPGTQYDIYTCETTE